MLAIIHFTASLNDCWSEHISRYCTFALSLFSLLRCEKIVNWSIVRSCGEYEQCWNGGIQCWFADTARGKVCDFAFLTSYGGEVLRFFHDNCSSHSSLTVKNRGCGCVFLGPCAKSGEYGMFLSCVYSGLDYFSPWFSRHRWRWSSWPSCCCHDSAPSEQSNHRSGS